ncbi:putative Xeroderma pigmentosum group G protein [Klebsormidium nitens]|uniref:Putative Xeroderma pigmentosum group G protein n=1 Tax=Klebsormidium nitens TaxID=105231 RepID=A0A1Y1III0_KLENI|nr:putative Xeroderma pigmentosum group G protein [Klebsormidium nitens]|eukprot:GAQ89269.1 putative Xeroderma pigmentosum group G protein [Klebsormidium nitens]
MGVQGLWELLAPVGRRVSVEALGGKRLAVDASIWIVQFMKAMRNDQGEMLRNAHLLGFFRRICKLLYLRVKPVFVFDGGTPALKRQTVMARRRQRDKSQAKIRKTAEKLLLNHLRTQCLEELVEKKTKASRLKMQSPVPGATFTPDSAPPEEPAPQRKQRRGVRADGRGQFSVVRGAENKKGKALKRRLRRRIKEKGVRRRQAAAQGGQGEDGEVESEGDGEEDVELEEEEEEEEWEEGQGGLGDGDAGASTNTHAAQGAETGKVIGQMSQGPGQSPPGASAGGLASMAGSAGTAARNFRGEQGLGLPGSGMSASIERRPAAEPQGAKAPSSGPLPTSSLAQPVSNGTRSLQLSSSAGQPLQIMAGPSGLSSHQNGGPSANGLQNEGAGTQAGKGEEDDEEEEEGELIMMPDTDNALDPTVLASLPASVQIELMQQMRERRVAQNREKFRQVAKVPESFSSIQMEAYLKNVAMRRDVAKVHEAMAKGTKVIPGMEDVPAMRIASEQGREFIFKSNPERADSESQDGFKAALGVKGLGRGLGARKVQKPGALKWRQSEKDKVESYKEKPSWFKASPYGLGEVKLESVSDGVIGVVNAETVSDAGYGELQVVKEELESAGGSGKVLVAIDPELAVLDTNSQWSMGGRSWWGGEVGRGARGGGREGRGRGGRGDNGADKFLGGWMKVLKLTKDEWEDGAGGGDVAVSVEGGAEVQGDDLFTADMFKKGGAREKLDPGVVAEVARAAAERLAKANGLGGMANGMGGTEQERADAEISIGIQVAQKDGGEGGAHVNERVADESGRGADVSEMGNGHGLVVSEDEMDWEDGGVLETGGVARNSVAATIADQAQTEMGAGKFESVENVGLKKPGIASRGLISKAGARRLEETLVLTADGESVRPFVMDDGSDVEWEDGSGQFGKADPVSKPLDFSSEQSETAGSLDDLATLAAVLDDPTGALPSIGALAEDADLEEAIRRSLKDFQGAGGAAGGGKASKGIVIREGKGAGEPLAAANNGKQPATDSVVEIADGEEAFFARERARKGKGRVGEEQAARHEEPDCKVNKPLTGAANVPSSVQTGDGKARPQQTDISQVQPDERASGQVSDQTRSLNPPLVDAATLPPSVLPSILPDPIPSAPAVTADPTVSANPSADLNPQSKFSPEGLLTPPLNTPSKITPPAGSNPLPNPVENPSLTGTASKSSARPTNGLPKVSDSLPPRPSNMRNPFADDAPPSFPDIDELLEDEEELSEDRHELERREKEAQDWERAEQETLEMEAAIAESLVDSVPGTGGPEFRAGASGSAASGVHEKQLGAGESSRRELAGSRSEVEVGRSAGLDFGGSSDADAPNGGAAHEPDAALGASGGVRIATPRGGEVMFEGSTQQGRLLREQETRRAEREKLAEEKAKREALEKEAEMQDERERLAAEEAALQAEIERERALLEDEEAELQYAQRANTINAESATGEMFSECQELLQMFGIPFIIAPMEAEAQCAAMDKMGLVDGVVTDDSDVFLFGAKAVYKNIFDNKKYVETYYLRDIESEMGLDQQKLINMATLLGSDYTEGISGIGIVNAIEVVNAFSGPDGLSKFRDWLDAPDEALFAAAQKNAKAREKRNQAENKASAKIESDDEDRPLASLATNRNSGTGTGEALLEVKAEVKEDAELAIAANLAENRAPKEENEETVRLKAFAAKHRNVSKNWTVPPRFPDRAVVAAYTRPRVDTSEEKFEWGRPDLEALHQFCFERFSWRKDKSDEILQPVVKAFDAHESQTRLESFFGFSQRFAKIRSKRIAKAVTGITGKKNAELMADEMEAAPVKKGRKKKRDGKAIESGSARENAAEAGTTREAAPARIGGNKETNGKLIESGAEGEEIAEAGTSRGVELDPEIGRSIEKAARSVGRGAGRGTRGRGKAAPRGRGETGTRGRGRGRGRGAEVERAKELGTGQADVLNGGPAEAAAPPSRRSKRQRAQVAYAEPSIEHSDASVSDYQLSDDDPDASPSKRPRGSGSKDRETRLLQAAEAVAAAKPRLAGVGGVSDEAPLREVRSGDATAAADELLGGAKGFAVSEGLEVSEAAAVEARESGGGFVLEEDDVTADEEALHGGGGFVPDEEEEGIEPGTADGGLGKVDGTGEGLRTETGEVSTRDGDGSGGVDDAVLRLTSDPADFASRLEETMAQPDGGVDKPSGRQFLTPLKRKKQVRFQEDREKPEPKAPRPSLYLGAAKGPVSGSVDGVTPGIGAGPVMTGPGMLPVQPGGAPVGGMVWINRGPVLNLWVAVVAVRQGFSFEEGLSFGKAVTTMYAQTKGRRLGIIKGGGAEEQEMEGVEMYRVFNTELPAKRLKDGLQAVSENRLLAPGPIKAFLSKAFAHNWASARAAMELLAGTYDPEELGAECYNLYVRFRPSIQDGVKGWGQKGLLDLGFISGTLVREKQERGPL